AQHLESQRLFQQIREIDADSNDQYRGKSATGQGPSKRGFGQRLKEALKRKQFDFGPPEHELDSQSILDEHCEQVFGRTPSPGSVSGVVSAGPISGLVSGPRSPVPIPVKVSYADEIPFKLTMS